MFSPPMSEEPTEWEDSHNPHSHHAVMKDRAHAGKRRQKNRRRRKLAKESRRNQRKRK